MKDRTYIIYALIDPRDDSVRYVGITDNMPYRLMHHLREAGSRTANSLDQLRKRAGLQVKELTDLADVSETSYRKMVRGEPVGETLIYKVLRVLSERLGREITLKDVSGLNPL